MFADIFICLGATRFSDPLLPVLQSDPPADDEALLCSIQVEIG
jgi:hypothetical protein